MNAQSVEIVIEKGQMQGVGSGRLVRRLGPIDSLGMAGRTETYASEEVAFCSCGEQINIVHDSDVTNRTDRIRLRYPDDTEGWCAFRCRNCHQEAKPTPNASAHLPGPL